MGWYTVVKTINRRRYLYLQMTYRLGGKVKTKNKYIGPVGTAFSWEPRPADRISQDLKHATIERDILRDHIASHPARRFLKYRGRTDRQSIGGTSFAELNAQALETGTKGKHLDTMLSESGYDTFEDLDESVEEYFNSKQQLAEIQQHVNALRTETSYAKKYHRALGTAEDQESIAREIAEPPPRVPKFPRPAGGLRIGRIRRLKPRTRDVINREAAKHRLFKEALANLDELRDARRAGSDEVGVLKATDIQYRRTYRMVFGKALRVRKTRR